MHPEIEAVTETPLWKFLVKSAEEVKKARAQIKKAAEELKKARAETLTLLDRLFEEGHLSEEVYRQETLALKGEQLGSVH